MDLSLLKEIAEKVLQTSGPWVALLVLAVWYHLRYVEAQATARLADKDAEIARVVEQRNRLEALLLSNRKSSGL